MWKQSVGNRCRRDSATILENQVATLKNYTDRGFTLQEQLDNLSFVDMNGRVYDPTVGRFISADPFVPDPLDSQSFNRYSYVLNRPLAAIDPSGFFNGPLFSQGLAEFGSGYFGLKEAQALGTVGVFLIAFGGSSVQLKVAGVGLTLYALTVAAVSTDNAFTGAADITSGLFDLPPISDPLQSVAGPNTAELLQLITLQQALKSCLGRGECIAAVLESAKEILQRFKKKQPPQAPPPAPKGPGPGGGGGGGENGPNRNPQFENLGPTTCKYTWYDLYSGNEYIGSGGLSVQCF